MKKFTIIILFNLLNRFILCFFFKYYFLQNIRVNITIIISFFLIFFIIIKKHQRKKLIYNKSLIHNISRETGKSRHHVTRDVSETPFLVRQSAVELTSLKQWRIWTTLTNLRSSLVSLRFHGFLKAWFTPRWALWQHINYHL